MPIGKKNAPAHGEWRDDGDGGNFDIFDGDVEAEDREESRNKSESYEDGNESYGESHEFTGKAVSEEGGDEEEDYDRDSRSKKHDDFWMYMAEPFSDDHTCDAEPERGDDDEDIADLECECVPEAPENDGENTEEHDTPAEECMFADGFAEDARAKDIQKDHLRSTEELRIGNTRFFESAQEEHERAHGQNAEAKHQEHVSACKVQNVARKRHRAKAKEEEEDDGDVSEEEEGEGREDRPQFFREGRECRPAEDQSREREGSDEPWTEDICEHRIIIQYFSMILKS